MPAGRTRCLLLTRRRLIVPNSKPQMRSHERKASGSESGHSNIQYNTSSLYAVLICFCLSQDITRQIPASLVEHRSPTLLCRDDEIGDGSSAVRIVRQLEVDTES